MSTADELDLVLAEAGLEDNPWVQTDSVPTYRHDPDLLARLMEIPVKDSATTQSGRVAKSVDAWIAHEFCRAGFDPDAVWPRATYPGSCRRRSGNFWRNSRRRPKPPC